MCRKWRPIKGRDNCRRKAARVNMKIVLQNRKKKTKKIKKSSNI